MTTQSEPQPAARPERVPLARLAVQSTGSLSPALTRIVAGRVERGGPDRVAAGFTSAV